MSKTITAYKDCKECVYLERIDPYYMHCKARDKKYMYGQSIPCDDKEKKNNNTKEKKMEIKIKKLTETAKIPTRGSDYAAGYDLYADIQEPIEIGAMCTIKIPTGIATEIPNGYFGAIFPRSGLATKKDLNLINCVAIIDEDYRGEWFIPLRNNNSFNSRVIEPGERIAQLILLPYQTLEFTEVEELSETNRGRNGFGSTGTN